MYTKSDHEVFWHVDMSEQDRRCVYNVVGENIDESNLTIAYVARNEAAIFIY